MSDVRRVRLHKNSYTGDLFQAALVPADDDWAALPWSEHERMRNVVEAAVCCVEVSRLVDQTPETQDEFTTSFFGLIQAVMSYRALDGDQPSNLTPSGTPGEREG